MDSELLKRPIEELRVRAPICVSPDTSVRWVVRNLQTLRAGCVLVTDDDGKLVGILTERDILRNWRSLAEDGADRPVSELMTSRPTALHVDDSVAYALHQMHIGGYRHIPLVDEEGRPVHVVSIRTFVDYLAERLDSDA